MLKLTSHQLSLQCYLEARENPQIHPARYEDLEALLNLFGLTDSAEAVRLKPVQFDFRFNAPSILIVDDEIEIADAIKDGLIGSKYPGELIRTFSSGEDAIGYAKRHSVEIALVDVKLITPFSIQGTYISGLHVLETIKKTSPESKVILISGFFTYAMVCEAILDLKATFCLGKPFTLAEITPIVQWAVEQLKT